MECLPFVRRLSNLRAYMIPESPGSFNRKAFPTQNRKQRNSTASSDSSSGSDVTITPKDNRFSSHSYKAADEFSLGASDQYSTSTGGYVEDVSRFAPEQNPYSYSQQMSRSCDESTVFSLSNEMDIVVKLKDCEDFLGISIVGQNYSNGDCNLFVGAVLPRGAVSRDGRIQPGDLILAVNGEQLDGKSNKEAVAMLRQAVRAHREVTLTIVGSFDSESVYSDGTCVRPIDPLLWLAHNSLLHQSDEAGLQQHPVAPRQRYARTQTSITSSSLSSSMPSTAARLKCRSQQQAMPLETPTDIIANRLRLHIIARNNSNQRVSQPNGSAPPRSAISINGVELQMWLYKNMRGFKDLAEVENYATHMISNGYLIPAGSYLQSGGHKSVNLEHVEFNRKENYIVNTRPMSPAVRSMTPVRQSSITTRSNTPLSVCEEVPTDKLQLLKNQLSSTGLSVRRY